MSEYVIICQNMSLLHGSACTYGPFCTQRHWPDGCLHNEISTIATLMSSKSPLATMMPKRTLGQVDQVGQLDKLKPSHMILSTGWTCVLHLNSTDSFSRNTPSSLGMSCAWDSGGSTTSTASSGRISTASHMNGARFCNQQKL